MSSSLSVNISNSVASSQGSGNRSPENLQVLGRVLDIILDESHPEYENQGGAKSINGVFLRILGTRMNEDTVTTGLFAYHGNTSVKTIPVVGEIVSTISLPSSRKGGENNIKILYYLDVVNIFNHPNHNAYLDVFSENETDVTSGGKFLEDTTVNPTRIALGDTFIGGRQGQSFRFTGAIGSANPWIDKTNVGSPLMILSNGQKEADTPFETVVEDVNEDKSSIYICADHIIPLVPSNTFDTTYKNLPETVDTFKGNQVLLSTGRLILNTKDSDLLMFSAESAGISAKTIHLEAKDSMYLDGLEIILGEKAKDLPKGLREPVLLGHQTETFLNYVLDILQGMATDMSTAATINGLPIPLLNKRGAQTLPIVAKLKTMINPSGKSSLKSKKVFTE